MKEDGSGARSERAGAKQSVTALAVATSSLGRFRDKNEKEDEALRKKSSGGRRENYLSGVIKEVEGKIKRL